MTQIDSLKTRKIICAALLASATLCAEKTEAQSQARYRIGHNPKYAPYRVLATKLHKEIDGAEFEKDLMCLPAMTIADNLMTALNDYDLIDSRNLGDADLVSFAGKQAGRPVTVTLATVSSGGNKIAKYLYINEDIVAACEPDFSAPP